MIFLGNVWHFIRWERSFFIFFAHFLLNAQVSKKASSCDAWKLSNWKIFPNMFDILDERIHSYQLNKVRLWLPREELICDWIKAAQPYIHQQDPDLIPTTPTISRTQQCWPSWVEGIGWRGRPLANIGRQRNAASCLAPPQLTPSRSNSSTMALEHSSTIFLCCLVGVWNISDDPFRNQNMNNKDHRVG